MAMAPEAPEGEPEEEGAGTEEEPPDDAGLEVVEEPGVETGVVTGVEAGVEAGVEPGVEAGVLAGVLPGVLPGALPAPPEVETGPPEERLKQLESPPLLIGKGAVED